MWKVLIADDEPKIRQGLKNTIQTLALPLRVCAEARNGLEALDKAREQEPDILLVDICMPKLNGIRFLEEVKKLSLDCRIIIISGYNEFSYAKQAITLGVSNYLLKPVADGELKAALEEVIRGLETTRESRKFFGLMRQQIKQNENHLRDVFFNDWIGGELTETRRQEQMALLGISMPEKVHFVLASVQPGYGEKVMSGAVSEELYRITLEKILRNAVEGYEPVYVFSSRYQEAIAMVGGFGGEPELLCRQIQEEMKGLVCGKCSVQIQSCDSGQIPEMYEKLHSQSQKMMECRPIVVKAREYIYTYYRERNLDLTQVAEAIGSNPSYLSRLMKQELGISFKDFLTMLRISSAIQLMRDKQLSLNQIAEKVGYNNQHYFSAAFKNCQGVSPSEFRRKLVQENK